MIKNQDTIRLYVNKWNAYKIEKRLGKFPEAQIKTSEQKEISDELGRILLQSSINTASLEIYYSSRAFDPSKKNCVFFVDWGSFLSLCSEAEIHFCIDYISTINEFDFLLSFDIIDNLIKINEDIWGILAVNQRDNLSIFLRNYSDIFDWQYLWNCTGIKLNSPIILEFKEYFVKSDMLIDDKRDNYPKKNSRFSYNLAGACNVDWSFELISNLKNNLDWDLLSGNKNLLFTKEIIESFMSNWNWEKLSKSNSVSFSKDLILEFADKWNWNYLSKNTSINFSKELIKEFADKWDWKALVSNESIYWTSGLIREFKEYIPIHYLCMNRNVDWENVINNSLFSFSGFKDIPWDIVSNNPGLNFDLIKYESLLHYLIPNKKDIQGGRIFEVTDKYNFKPIDRTKKYVFKSSFKYGTYTESAPGLKLSIKPCLSSNTGINWTDELISHFLLKLDFWIIALRGKISAELVMKYAAFFDEIRYWSSNYIKHSDWGTFEEYHFHNGWQNLLYNPNFTLTDELLDWGASRKVRIIEPYDIGESPNHTDPGTTTLINSKGKWVTVDQLLRGIKNPLKMDYSSIGEIIYD